MPSLCFKTTFFSLLHVHTYGCLLEHQLVSLFSVVCIFECFSLLVFWACLICSFTCCVRCCHCALKQLFFPPACTYLWLSTGTSACKFAFCGVYFEGFSLLMFLACLFSRFTCCVTCYHCALNLLFFSPACAYLWLSTGTSGGKFVFCCVYF